MAQQVSSDYQTAMALGLQGNPTLQAKLVSLKSNQGVPVYSFYYIWFQKYLMSQVWNFNNRLRKFYPLNQIKSSGLLDLSAPVFKHYSARFPEHQFKVESLRNSYILKPACCGHAFSYWASKKSVLLKKEIVHEVSDCYRVEKHGTVRALNRNCYFTMPDYHLLTNQESLVEDFERIKSFLKDFFIDLMGSLDHFSQITRFLNPSSTQLKELKESELYEILEPVKGEQPYYEKKWELSYRGSNKLFTLATVQVDKVYPQLFNLNQEGKPTKVGIHFSMGSLPRIVQALITENRIPERGVKLASLIPGPSVESYVRELNLSCDVLIEDRSKSMKEVLPYKSKYEQWFFSKIILVAPKQWTEGHVILIDRKTRSQELIPKEQISSKLSGLSTGGFQDLLYSSTLIV